MTMHNQFHLIIIIFIMNKQSNIRTSIHVKRLVERKNKDDETQGSLVGRRCNCLNLRKASPSFSDDRMPS